MEKKSNQTKEVVILVVGIILFLVLFAAQGGVSRALASGQQVPPFMSSLNGIIAQAHVLISTFLVVAARKKGYIAAVILNLISAVSVVINSRTPIGIVVSLISIVTITVIYVYYLKVSKANEELSVTNNELRENNRIMREKDEKLTYLAYYDVLTGLANRQLFIEQIDDMIETNSKTPFTVIFFDIDDFKQINDSYGHNTGDVMLSTYADRLRLFCGEENFVGKLGGDEFAVILPGAVTESGIVSYIERLRNAVCKPVQVEGTVLRTSMSFGVASYPNDGANSQDILKSTDIAVYNAKANGKDRTCFYSQQSLNY